MVYRIKTLPPVKYASAPRGPYNKIKREIKKKREVEIYIPEGTNPEVYTEEHEKLLGDCETAWELFVDGYDEDGDRICDPNKGEKCHQCGYYGFILFDFDTLSPLKGLLVLFLHDNLF